MPRQHPLRVATCRCLAVVVWLLGVAPLRGQEAGIAIPDPDLPGVTRREADLLNDTATRATTDLGGAITQLQAQTGGDASAALDYMLGNLYMQTNQLAEAQAAYQTALRKWPRFRVARGNLARAYLLDDQPARAAETLGGLLSAGQADADDLLLLGQALSLAGQPLSAETAYRQALLMRPGDGEARRGLARCLLEQQRYLESEALVRELLAADPHQPQLWSLLASLQLDRDQAEAAQLSLETARRLDAITPDMRATLGELYLARGQAQEARDLLLAALAAEPGVTPRRLRAAQTLVALGEAEAATAVLAALEAGDGAQTEASSADRRTLRRLRAELDLQQGAVEEARAGYEALLREDPLDGESLLALGRIQSRTGHAEAAVMTFERAARLPGFEARALEQQAQVEVARGRYATAIPLLERALVFEDQPHVARYLEQVRRLLR